MKTATRAKLSQMLWWLIEAHEKEKVSLHTVSARDQRKRILDFVESRFLEVEDESQYILEKEEDKWLQQ